MAKVERMGARYRSVHSFCGDSYLDKHTHEGKDDAHGNQIEPPARFVHEFRGQLHGHLVHGEDERDREEDPKRSGRLCCLYF